LNNTLDHTSLSSNDGCGAVAHPRMCDRRKLSIIKSCWVKQQQQQQQHQCDQPTLKKQLKDVNISFQHFCSIEITLCLWYMKKFKQLIKYDFKLFKVSIMYKNVIKFMFITYFLLTFLRKRVNFINILRAPFSPI